MPVAARRTWTGWLPGQPAAFSWVYTGVIWTMIDYHMGRALFFEPRAARNRRRACGAPHMAVTWGLAWASPVYLGISHVVSRVAHVCGLKVPGQPTRFCDAFICERYLGLTCVIVNQGVLNRL